MWHLLHVLNANELFQKIHYFHPEYIYICIFFRRNRIIFIYIYIFNKIYACHFQRPRCAGIYDHSYTCPVPWWPFCYLEILTLSVEETLSLRTFSLHGYQSVFSPSIAVQVTALHYTGNEIEPIVPHPGSFSHSVVWRVLLFLLCQKWPSLTDDLQQEIKFRKVFDETTEVISSQAV